MRDLTKWPRLVVVPHPGHEVVTREQANEILVRTDKGYLSSNDRQWEEAVRRLMGHPHQSSCGTPKPGEVLAWIKAEEDWEAGLGMLDLAYCVNSQIMSSWVGGPHGWLDWDGNVGCSTWNIGKWPSCSDVQKDWDLIAAAFPYLNFHAQLITDEGEGDVAAQWHVTGGKAYLVEPIEKFSISEPDTFGRFFLRDGERGVSLNRLAEACSQVRSQLAKEKGKEAS